MKDETDESLITLMGFIDDERDTAEAAAGELFRRYSPRMTIWCAKAFLIHHQNHEELVMKTFANALNGAKAFAPQLAKHADPVAKITHIKLWLYRILKNVCIDAQRSEHLERELRSAVDVGKVKTIALDPPDDVPAEEPTNRRIDLVREFIARSDPLARAILINTMQYYDCGSGQVIVPKPMLDDLCRKFGLTRVYLRTKRCRLHHELHEFILQNE